MTDHRVQDNRGQDGTSSTLLVAVRARDPQAWQRLVRIYAPLLFRWCRQSRLQSADAADVIQEVFSAVAYSIDVYHHHQEGDTFRGWLRRITQHKICDRVRVGRREARGAGGADQGLLLGVADPHLPDPDEESERQDQLLVRRRAVDCILADYQEATRIAFLRVVVEGDHP